MLSWAGLSPCSDSGPLSCMPYPQRSQIWSTLLGKGDLCLALSLLSPPSCQTEALILPRWCRGLLFTMLQDHTCVFPAHKHCGHSKIPWCSTIPPRSFSVLQVSWYQASSRSSVTFSLLFSVFWGQKCLTQGNEHLPSYDVLQDFTVASVGILFVWYLVNQSLVRPVYFRSYLGKIHVYQTNSCALGT